jgi:hypothetical protein
MGADLYGQPCRACAFDWRLTPSEAVALVRDVPARFNAALSEATGQERHPDLVWTPCAYVSHVTDNLRTWAERLVSARATGETDVPGYDPDVMARVRNYDQIALAGARWSLDWAAREWAEAVEESLKTNVVMHHATRGLQCAADVARNNAHDAHHHHLYDVERILADAST